MPQPPVKNGDVIDDFVVNDLVYSRGMAHLWSVTHPDIDIPLLMKVPMIGEGDDPASIVGFEMEQMIMPRLVGPHVPRFFANGDFSVLPYIVMEWVQGPTLFPLLEELPLAPDKVIDIGIKIAVALDALHRQNVVHLDVKPSNVLLRATGEAVLIDYGLAHHNGLPDLMQEQFHLPYGTAPYMAPEQLIGIRSDHRSDLFALGVLMYFFATGVRPFGNPERLKTMKRRLWRDPIPPRALNIAISEALQEVILHCLEVDPASRYPAAAQVAFDLRNLSEVTLTARARKMEQDNWGEALYRRFHPVPIKPMRGNTTETQRADAPIIVAAIDLRDDSRDLAESLRRSVTRIRNSLPDARIACINVLKINRLALDTALDESGRNKHVMRLAELRAWAEPLHAEEGGITFHVLEAISPAEAILTYARTNYVDHIVMGARAESTIRSMLGSVSGAVAAHAPCSVTVVRNRTRREE